MFIVLVIKLQNSSSKSVNFAFILESQTASSTAVSSIPITRFLAAVDRVPRQVTRNDCRSTGNIHPIHHYRPYTDLREIESMFHYWTYTHSLSKIGPYLESLRNTFCIACRPSLIRAFSIICGQWRIRRGIGAVEPSFAARSPYGYLKRGEIKGGIWGVNIVKWRYISLYIIIYTYQLYKLYTLSLCLFFYFERWGCACT